MGPGMERGTYVRMLSAVYASMFLIRVAFGITLVTFASYLSSGDFVYSLVVSASPLLELLTVAFAGVIIDRYGRKGVLLTGLGLGAISLYGLALTKNPILLGFVNAIHGIAAALILVTTLAIIASFAPPEHRGREMGFFNLANIFGWIAGFAVGGLLLDAFDGRLEYTFVLAGLLATAGLLFANRMIPANVEPPMRSKADLVPHDHQPSIRELAKALSKPRLMLLIVPWLIVFMLVGPFITFFPRVGGDLQISGARTAMGVLVVGALLVGSQLFWGRLADKFGRERIMLVGAVGFALLMGIVVYGFFEVGSIASTEALPAFEVTAGATAASAPLLYAQSAPGPVPDAGDPVPVVEDVDPTSGPPGTQVTLVGRGFLNVTGVRFNGVPASFAIVDGTRLVATVPAGAGTGPLHLLSPTAPQAIFQNVMSHALLLTVFLFTALAFAPAGLAAIADEAKGGAEGTTMSAYSLTLSLGFIVGPPVVGAISEAFGGTGMVIYFAALAAGLLALVVARFLTAGRREGGFRA
jgi:MFS family permease